MLLKPSAPQPLEYHHRPIPIEFAWWNYMGNFKGEWTRVGQSFMNLVTDASVTVTDFGESTFLRLHALKASSTNNGS